MKKGQRVEEITKKTGRRPRTGIVVDLRGDQIEVQWDDGHTSSLIGAYLRPVDDKGAKTGKTA